MEIQLPTTTISSNNSDSWKEVVHSSNSTTKEQLKELVFYNSVLSGKTKELDDNIKKYTKLVEDSKEKLQRVENLLYVGFIALMFVVAGIGYSYIEFISSQKNNVDKNDNKALQQQIDDQDKKFELFKQCLQLGGWNKCFK